MRDGSDSDAPAGMAVAWISFGRISGADSLSMFAVSAMILWYVKTSPASMKNDCDAAAACDDAAVSELAACAGEAVCDAAAACDDAAVSDLAVCGGECVSDAAASAFTVRGRFGVTIPVWICAGGTPRSSATYSRLALADMIRCWLESP